jgi:hypothetical protein
VGVTRVQDGSGVFDVYYTIPGTTQSHKLFRDEDRLKTFAKEMVRRGAQIEVTERTLEEEAADQRANRIGGWIAAAVIAAVVVWAAVASSGGGDDTSSGGNSIARSACRHFRNVAADASVGILSAGELRSKLQEVNNDAQYVGSLAGPAQQMLRGVTLGGTADISGGIGRMSAACSAMGL